MLVAVQRPTLNGNMGFYGGKNRSPSLCSLDEGSHLESLLEEADKIGAAKNGLGKGVRTKKQVRFDMGRNEQFYYSYMVSSDDDSGKFDMEHHINYVNYERSNGYDDSYDEDEDDDEDEEHYEEEEEEESDAENSETEISPGLLVNKSTVVQNGFSEHSDSSTFVVENGREEQKGRLEKFEGDHEDTCSAGLAEEKASHLESALSARQMSVKREISDLGEQLRKVREDTKQEMDRLQRELENRRTEYLTEMEEFHRNREEQKCVTCV